MNVTEWGIVVGVATSGVLALAPWMFMVHAKLAVIAAQLAALGEKVDNATEASQQLWSQSAQHEVRLKTHDVQFAHVAERLREM